jgi:single-stranded DNA-binding protein
VTTQANPHHEGIRKGEIRVQNGFLVGKVTDKYVSDQGKVAFTRVTVEDEIFLGLNDQNEPKTGRRFTQVVCFRDQAKKLATVDKGALVAFSGEFQSGKPYQDKNGEWRSQLEMHRVSNWNILDGSGSAAPSSPVKEETTGSASGGAVEEDDPFQN